MVQRVVTVAASFDWWERRQKNFGARLPIPKVVCGEAYRWEGLGWTNASDAAVDHLNENGSPDPRAERYLPSLTQ